MESEFDIDSEKEEIELYTGENILWNSDRWNKKNNIRS